MTAEIVSPFGGVRPTVDTPVDVQALLTDLQERADRGELRGLAVAYVEGNGTCSTDWAAGVAPANSMVGVVARLAHRIVKALDDL